MQEVGEEREKLLETRPLPSLSERLDSVEVKVTILGKFFFLSFKSECISCQFFFDNFFFFGQI